MTLQLVVEDFGGGYRPTAVGIIGQRMFYFRWMGGGWSFGVSADGVTEGDFWWHSPPDKLAFEIGGDGPIVWETESVPTFIGALRSYLATQGLSSDEQDALERDARRQVDTLLSGAVTP